MISEISKKRIISASGGITGSARFCKLLSSNNKQRNNEKIRNHGIDELFGPRINIFD